MSDVNTCPNCGGEADNGFDRCVPPNPYWCSKCERAEETISNGWASDYYELPKDATELQDLIEYREMNFAVGNIFKAAYRLGQKKGVDRQYDLRKIQWYAQRELARIEGDKE